MLLQDVLKEFIFDCRMRKLSERTIKSYKNNNLALFRYFENEFELTELEEVTRAHIQEYIRFLVSKELTEVYINSVIKCFRSFFNYAIEEGYILEKRNPMNKVKFQKEPKVLINTFNDDEVRKMINYYGTKKFLDTRNRCIMIILFDTGIRNNELCDIKMGHVRDTYIEIHGKGKKIRHVPITVIMNKILIRYLRVRENYIKDKSTYETEYLFLSQKGRKLTIETVENIVKKCGEGCNVRPEIRCSPHTCRHYYAQSQLKNGCDLFTVSKLLGHDNINITKRYLQSISNDDFFQLACRTSPLSNLK